MKRIALLGVLTTWPAGPSEAFTFNGFGYGDEILVVRRLTNGSLGSNQVWLAICKDTYNPEDPNPTHTAQLFWQDVPDTNGNLDEDLFLNGGSGDDIIAVLCIDSNCEGCAGAEGCAVEDYIERIRSGCHG